MSSELEPLCDALSNNIETVTVRWVRRVRHDPYLKSDDHLTLTQIVDHVPQMLEELCEMFRYKEEPDFDTIRASSEHGYIRAAQGYSLTELLREIEVLRDCVFDFVAETEEAQQMERDTAIDALRRINKYFSEDIIFVVEHYLASKKASGQNETES